MADVRNLQQLVNDRLAELGDRRGPLSARQAAMRSNGQVSYETLRLIARGDHSGRLTDEVVAGLALALDVPRSRVLAAMGRSMTQPLGRFELPARADYLSRQQRKVVLSVVDAILDAADAELDAPVRALRPVAKAGRPEDAEEVGRMAQEVRAEHDAAGAEAAAQRRAKARAKRLGISGPDDAGLAT